MKRTILILMIFVIFFGCAVAPPKKEKQPPVFYPPLPQQPKLEFLHSISGENDLGRSKSSFDEFLLGQVPSEKNLGKVYDIGSSKGKIYILDRAVKKIIIIDLIKKEMNYIKDQRLGILNDPSGIWITGDDVKYVADMKRKQIVVFDRDNKFLRVYGSKSIFDRPVDVAVFKNFIYVSDMNKNQVFVFEKNTGKLKMAIGKTGMKEGEFYKPTHVIVDHAGNIYVNDAFNFRIQKFDREGNFLKSFGFLGDNLGALARPKGIDIDKKGHLYVVDAAFENVQIFDDKTSKLLLFFGGVGTAPGSMYLPAGVHIDYENIEYFKKYVDRDFNIKYLIYVGNMFGSRKLNVYGFGKWVGRALSGDQIKAGEKSKEKNKE